MSMINQYQQLGNYLFVSMNKDGKIGSVYYENGRIRLVHKNGPLISGHDCIAYFLVDNSYKEGVPNCKDSNFDYFYNYFVINKKGILLNLTNHGLIENSKYKDDIEGLDNDKKYYSIKELSETLTKGKHLHEIYFNSQLKAETQHYSRGYPFYIPISNSQPLEEVFDYIKRNDNLKNLTSIGKKIENMNPSEKKVVMEANGKVYSLMEPNLVFSQYHLYKI